MYKVYDLYANQIRKEYMPYITYKTDHLLDGIDEIKNIVLIE